MAVEVPGRNYQYHEFTEGLFRDEFTNSTKERRIELINKTEESMTELVNSKLNDLRDVELGLFHANRGTTFIVEHAIVPLNRNIQRLKQQIFDDMNKPNSSESVELAVGFIRLFNNALDLIDENRERWRLTWEIEVSHAFQSQAKFIRIQEIVSAVVVVVVAAFTFLYCALSQRVL